MKKTALLILVLPAILFSQKKLTVPNFEDVLSLPAISNPQISPNGKNILFQVRSADWEANRYDTEIWISKNGNAPIQLTNNADSGSYSPKWSPDGKWIAFLSNNGEGNQIQIIPLKGGEPLQVTNIKGGINSFEWAPDSEKFAITMEQRETESDIARKKRYGEFEVVDKNYKLSWLYSIDFDPNKNKGDGTKWTKPTALIDKVNFSIDSFKWSPDGTKIVFDKQPNPLADTFLKSDIGILNVKRKEWQTLVENTGFDFLFDWSPDSKSIVYVSSLTSVDDTYYKNSHFLRVDIDGENQKELGVNFDEELSNLTWTSNGIYATAHQKTLSKLFLINPINGDVKTISNNPERVYEFSIAKSNSKIAFLGEIDSSLKEVYVACLDKFKPEKITNYTNQISQWTVGSSEVISWKSTDGITIEGVLHKPDDYDSAKKYPLLVVVHGGPAMIDSPTPLPALYPITQWLNKGALVLRPNYRGSGGYGEKFRSLNVGNMGFDVSNDILSGIDYLDNLGVIDTSKMGCMGWSMGGYISAFLATTSNIFKAISVGAGISDWFTFYTNTDVQSFTRQYLKGTPWSNESVYKKASPITYINKATTPTLIQHGEFDNRVPIANAYILNQGLKDLGVDSKFVIYKGFGHTVYKPKERLAVVNHNWEWFNKYIFGEK